jgi:hypothetical protein
MVHRNSLQKLGPAIVVPLAEIDCEMNESFVVMQRSSECLRLLAIVDIREVQSLEILIASKSIDEADERLT